MPRSSPCCSDHDAMAAYSDDDASAHSGYESALAEPLSPGLDSSDDGDVLVAHRANPNAPAPAAHAGQTLMHRLALRVQAAAAGGPQDAGGPNSPQLDPVRQELVDQAQQNQQVRQQVHHQMQMQVHHQQAQHLQQMQQAQHFQRLQQQVQQMQQRVQQVHQMQQHAPQVQQHAPQVQQQPQEENAAEDRFKFRCKHCPDRFTHINLLTRHQNEVHPVTKPFVCPEATCARGYVMREVMEAHYMMVHRNERPYPCDQCEKVFSRREYLVTHSRVHTGFKPYQCGDCGRRFAWKGCIDVHRRTHTGERPYLCITCSRDFATLGTLKLHEMIHTNSFPHPCQVCNRKFRRSYDLRMHSQFHEREAAEEAEVDNSRTEDEVAVVEVDNSRTEDEVAVAVLNEL